MGAIATVPGGIRHVHVAGAPPLVLSASVVSMSAAVALFPRFTFAAWAAVVVAAGLVRGRPFVVFAAVLLGLHGLLSTALVGANAAFFAAAPAPIVGAAFALQAVTYAHFLMLARPRLRPLVYRAFVSIPAAFFVSASFLSLPWSIVHAFGVAPPLPWVPFVLAAFGVVQSLVTREEERDVYLDGLDVGTLRPLPRDAAGTAAARPLRIVQITDPHLGPMMSVERLQRICQRAVDRAPDLVFLTGDFLTMESQSDVAHLRDALSPLRALEGRVFACFGNHDHEAPELVRRALYDVGATQLVDDAATIDTPAGPVQIVGFDFARRDRKARIDAVCARHPRRDEAARIALLHDPGAFHLVPEGAFDLVLSGHTHGGQVGLLSVGSPWTFIRLVARGYPDHGLWGRGRDRLYVHRGTGLYGFPLRVGVPAEESLLRIHRDVAIG
jgi:predicted MPP superfamily phosphohydrolase